MQDYDLIWDNHPSSQMGPADALSRHDEVDTSLDNTGITMLPTVSDVLIRALDVRLAERIADFTATDLLVQDARNAMSKHTFLFPHVLFDDWMFLEGSLYFRGHLYVPEPACQNLVRSLHCSPADTSALFTWFNATTGGLVLPPSFADLWLAALLARPTKSTLIQRSLDFAPSP